MCYHNHGDFIDSHEPLVACTASIFAFTTSLHVYFITHEINQATLPPKYLFISSFISEQLLSYFKFAYTHNCPHFIEHIKNKLCNHQLHFLLCYYASAIFLTCLLYYFKEDELNLTQISLISISYHPLYLSPIVRTLKHNENNL